MSEHDLYEAARPLALLGVLLELSARWALDRPQRYRRTLEL